MGQAAAWNYQRVVAVCKTLLPTLNQGYVFISSAAVKTLSETHREVKEANSDVAAACFTYVPPPIFFFPLQNFLLSLNKKRIGDNDVLQFISSLQIFFTKIICEFLQYFSASLTATVS